METEIQIRHWRAVARHADAETNRLRARAYSQSGPELAGISSALDRVWLVLGRQCRGCDSSALALQRLQ
jgi:hypothetical protein